MEKRFDMSDFERSLKDHADQFKMMPSRRVWNGIYNNLHPGSKWPSITVAIVFLIALISVGNLNNSNKAPDTRENNFPAAINNKTEGNDKVKERESFSTEKNTRANSTGKTNNLIKPTNVIAEIKKAPGNIYPNKPAVLSAENHAKNSQSGIRETENSAEKNLVNSNDKYLTANGINNNTNTLLQKNIIPVKEAWNFQNENNSLVLTAATPPIKNNFALPASYKLLTFIPSESLTFIFEENENPGNSRIINAAKAYKSSNNSVKTHRKKNKNIEWLYYVNPTISTVSFRGKGIEPPVAANSPVVVLQNGYSNNMVHNARLGFETGTEMLFKFSKRWQLVTGGNISYSGYNIVSNLVHPTFATLMLKDKTGIYPQNYITHYGNGQSQNQISLSNYSLQLSLPVGLQYNIWGNKNMQINVASTFEPSAILKSNSFIMSSDQKYYISDPSLLRKMNISGNFGSFITFSSKKIKWHIGPNIHYQILSTYKNNYPVKEHLIYYGIKIGISKLK